MPVKSASPLFSIERLLSTCVILVLMLTGSYTALYADNSNASVESRGYAVPVGEKLVFKIEWDPPWYLFFFPNMHAGNAEVYVEGETEYEGQRVLKIQFRVYSTGMLAKLSGMKIADEFVYLTDPDTLCTLYASKRIREGKRSRQIDVQYLPETGQMHFREVNEALTPPELMKDILKDDIPACVRDPLSSLYDMRRHPIGKNFVFKSIIGDNDVVKEVESRVEKLEALDTAEGKIPAWRLRTKALMGGLFKKGGKFKIWLSADNRQVPLQFEVRVPLGKILGRLESPDPPETNRD